MLRFDSMRDLRRAFEQLPKGSEGSFDAVVARQQTLTKPPGSLGRLESLAAWLSCWQGNAMPRMDRVKIVVFAGNHGVTTHGISPYPSEVTMQMVANFNGGGAAINQLSNLCNASLQVIPLDLENPTRDFVEEPAMEEAAFLDAISAGYAIVKPDTDLLCLGEMGIGNTTAAAAICAALFGGPGIDWVGRGTGVDDAGLARKAAVVDLALSRHPGALGDPLRIAMTFGGRELSAILGATLAARLMHIPVLLDGFVSTAAAAPMAELSEGALDHAEIAHASAEAGHRNLIRHLGKTPILDLGMRLGEASGAALAVPILRAAVACHCGMATFADAGVSNRD